MLSVASECGGGCFACGLHLAPNGSGSLGQETKVSKKPEPSQEVTRGQRLLLEHFNVLFSRGFGKPSVIGPVTRRVAPSAEDHEIIERVVQSISVDMMHD
jgi:hypothetical protein